MGTTGNELGYFQTAHFRGHGYYSDTIQGGVRGREEAQAEALAHPDHPTYPDRALAAAVLHQTILDLRSDADPRMRADAAYYLFDAPPDPSWPFSFHSLAEVLGLDVESIRARLYHERPDGPLSPWTRKPGGPKPGSVRKKKSLDSLLSGK